MALADYTKTVWVNDSIPAINATNLNKIEVGIDTATDAIISLESTVADLPTTYEPKDTAIAKTDVNNLFSVGQKSSISAVTYAATIELDMDTSLNFSTTLTGNVTLGNPINMDDGEVQTGIIILTQDATGGRTVSFGTNWYSKGSSTPNTAANKINVYRYTVISSSIILYEHCVAI